MEIANINVDSGNRALYIDSSFVAQRKMLSILDATHESAGELFVPGYVFVFVQFMHSNSAINW